jgi:hypothetical protein
MRKMTKQKYQQVWGTQIGKDCINLDYALSKWLGKRLVHLGTHTNTRPLDYADDNQTWNRDLIAHGESLLAYSKSGSDHINVQTRKHRAAKEAMRFVAARFGQLWD